MSIFDYIGLTVCGLFFIVFGLAAIMDFIYTMRYDSKRLIWLPPLVTHYLGVLRGFTLGLLFDDKY